MAKYVKPTLETKFHIDFNWWANKNLASYLQTHACPEAEKLYDTYDQEEKTFDWIDPETGEVFQVDVLWHLIHLHCSQAPDFVDEYTPMTTAIFRTFIANNNTPLTPVELHTYLEKKSAELILRTIGKYKVYKGIRPVPVLS